jgi:hypothetical protein
MVADKRVAELITKIEPEMVTPTSGAEIHLRYMAIRVSEPEATAIAVLPIG